MQSYYNQPPTNCNPLKVNLHLSAHNASRKTSGWFFRVVDARAGRHVELPAVQRTIDVAVLGDAFAERAAAMRALSVERVKLPADVEQRQFTLAYSYTQSVIRRNLVHLGNGNKFAHRWRRGRFITASLAPFRLPPAASFSTAYREIL